MAGKSGQVDKVESCKTTYEWKIEGFDRELEPQPSDPTKDYFEVISIIHHRLRKKLVSQSFVAGGNAGIRSLWHVEIEDHSGEDWVGGEQLKATLIFENCIGTTTENVTPFSSHARLSILHPHISLLNHKFSPDFLIMDVKTNGEKAEFLITHREILKRVDGNKVSISVELEIFGNDYSVGIPDTDPSGGKDFGITNLQRDFEKLLMNQDLYDFTIECDGKIFKVHKSILAARSSVFAAMLNNKDFKECQTNTMVVEDIDQTSMEILLHYIYTGKVLTELMNDSNVLWPVIRGADKYDLSELKNHCFHQLAQSITTENFGPLVVLAIAIRAEQKEMVILKDYYLRNLPRLMKNADFRKLTVEHPEIIFED